MHESEAGKSKIGASRLEQPVGENTGTLRTLGLAVRLFWRVECRRRFL